MQKAPSRTRGISLVEVIVSAGIMLLLAVLFSGAVLYGEESTQIAGMRNRANMYAEEGLEAARSIRDKNYYGVANGVYGISQSGGVWAPIGASDTQDIFTRSVTVSTVDANTKLVTSNVTWPENGLRTGSTTLSTYFTNVNLLRQQSNYLVVSTSSAFLGGVLKSELRGITVQNIGNAPIVIDKVMVSWVNGTRQIQEIDIGGGVSWSSTLLFLLGTQPSGTNIDIIDYSLSTSTTPTSVNRFLFNGSMTPNAFTIVFTLGDGSTKTVSTGTLI